MRWPAGTIWDTRIQSVCAAVSARDGADVELWMCGNFGQISLSPPCIVINPNRLYPIESAIRHEGRFALSVFGKSHRQAALRLASVRRRSPNKAAATGIEIIEDERHRIPYTRDHLRVLFCEVEEVLDTGDHTVIIGRVLESRAHPHHIGEPPLLYPEILEGPSFSPRLSRAIRRTLSITRVDDAAREFLRRRRGVLPVDLPQATYRGGGQTEEEIHQILKPGSKDKGRSIFPPPARTKASLNPRFGVCVVGTSWGSFHAQLFRQAAPDMPLYLCGRNQQRLARLAKSVRAAGCILGLENALADPRIKAVSLALPHHMHADAVRKAAEAGKHVLLEKPIATTLAEADSIIDAARRAGIILMVAEDMHFRPSIREVVQAIHQGDIGEPLYLSVRAGGLMRFEGWKADSGLMGGGVLMDIGVHYIRGLRLLMGEPDRVFASRAMQVDTKISGEDSIQLLFDSSRGWQAHFLLSWAGPRGDSPDIIVSGEKGVIHLWPGRKFYDLYPALPTPITRWLSYVRPRWLSEKLARPEFQRVRRRIPDEDATGYLQEVQEFLSAVQEGRSPVTAPEDARRDVEIVLSGYSSLKASAWESCSL